MIVFTRLLCAVFLVSTVIATSAVAQTRALAYAITEGSAVTDKGRGFEIALNLTQAVPYRVFTLDDPKRLVIDFAEVNWSRFDPKSFDQARDVEAVRVGPFMAGWSRMVLDLNAPVALRRAEREGDTLHLRFGSVSAEDYAAKAGTPPEAQIDRPDLTQTHAMEKPDPLGTRAIKIMLDPGHGGIDPGAERAGVKESELMLQFALELREILLRTGRFEVSLTRERDEFVPLETRVAMTRAAQVDLFISLHADAIAEGAAKGATVYTLSDRASDEASRKLAERHNRDALLAGVDLSGQDDQIATVLMDIARTETKPRTDRLADALVTALEGSVGTFKRPRLEAGFSVLKSPDIPSVLLELGFLSSDTDRAKLTDPTWRMQAAFAVRDAVLDWEAQEIIAARAIRR